MARNEAEAALVETVEHLRDALALLDGLGTHQVIAAQVSLALENLRQEIHLLRTAAFPKSMVEKLPPHALG